MKCLLAITGAFALEGGIAVANRLVIHALADAQYTMDIFALNEDDNRVAYASFANTIQRGFNNNKYTFTLAVWAAILRGRYDFIFCDHTNLAAILYIPAKLRMIRYILRLNGVEVFAPLPDFEGRLGLSGAWKLQAISQFTKDKILQQFPDIKVEVVDLALDPLRWSTIDLPPSVNTVPIILQAVDGSRSPLQNRVILHVGRMSKLEQYKGQDKLIESMPLLMVQHPTVQLVIVGRGNDKERLLNLARSQSPAVQRAIFMPGFVADDVLEQLYQQCFVFAMPSRGEGFGLVYLEAMRWAKPCIGSRGDAAQSVIRENKTGLLVDDPTSWQSVAATVLWMLDHPAEAEKMGSSGYQLLCETYLYTHYRDRFIAHVKR